MKKLTAMLSVFLLCGCATYPVYGTVKGAKAESFIGSATTALGGNGNITITSDTGVKCEGEYYAPSSLTGATAGEGTLSCGNGLTGQFNFAGTTSSGQGFGTLSDGRKFEFYFGRVNIVKSQE
ncbi:MAG: hypothetical protein GC131_06315 [Alphaproteobacteria bacterium]|nr:hypothetical protein [Alphaproteobacteria bacterium]